MKREEINEIWEIIRETNKGLEETRKLVNRISDGWGRFVEGNMAPSAVKIFSGFGYRVLNYSFRHKVIHNGEVVAEIDTLIVANKEGKKFLFIGEAKPSCSSSDIEGFRESINKAREYLQEYKDYKIIGFIGGMNFGSGVDKFAVREGFYVRKPSGEAMVLDVPEGFEPKVF